MSETMSDSDNDEILMELDDSNICFSAKYSTRLKYVFFINDLFCDTSIGLSQINVMFRGDESVLSKIRHIRLAVFDKKHNFIYLGLACPDIKNSDPSVYVFDQWNVRSPLPLGSMSLSSRNETQGETESRLCIIISTSNDFDIQMVKFGADIIPVPSNYKCKTITKDIDNSMIHIKNGNIIHIEHAKDAADESLKECEFSEFVNKSENDSFSESDELDSMHTNKTWIDILDEFQYMIRCKTLKNRIT